MEAGRKQRSGCSEERRNVAAPTGAQPEGCSWVTSGACGPGAGCVTPGGAEAARSAWSRPELERSGPAWSFWKGLLERLWRTPRAELWLGLSRGMGTCQCLFVLSPTAMGGGRAQGSGVVVVVVWFASQALIWGGNWAPLGEAGGGALPLLSRVSPGLFPCVTRPHSPLGGGGLLRLAGGKPECPGQRRARVGSVLLPWLPPSLREMRTALGDQVPARLHWGPGRCAHRLWVGCSRRRKGHLLSTSGWARPLPPPCCCPRVASAATRRRGVDATWLPCPTRRSGRSPGSGFWFQQTGGGDC